MASDALTGNTSADIEQFDARCQQWLSEMSAGNEQSLDELFNATLNKVFGVAKRIVGDSTLAEDVAIDVYHEAWKKAATYERSRGRPITWLLTICRNRALDQIRHEASMTRKAEAAAAMDVPQSVAAPDDLLEAVETSHVVHGLLEKIAPEDRQLLALAYFRGLSHQQIADHVGLPLGTVKSRIRRALAALGEAVPEGLQEQYSHGG